MATYTNEDTEIPYKIARKIYWQLKEGDVYVVRDSEVCKWKQVLKALQQIRFLKGNNASYSCAKPFVYKS